MKKIQRTNQMCTFCAEPTPAKYDCPVTTKFGRQTAWAFVCENYADVHPNFTCFIHNGSEFI